MPKSHLPPRGGPQPFSYPSVRPAPATSPAPSSSLEEENRRLRAELQRARHDKKALPSPASGGASRRMVWVACTLCVVALLFSLLTLFYR